MNALYLAAMLLALASASSAQESDWLWQFVDDEEKDGPKIQQQIRRGAKEIARLLHETRGEGEGEGDNGSEDNTPSPPTPSPAQATPSPPMPAVPTPLPPTPAEQTTASPTPAAATPAPPPLAQPTPSPTAAEDGTGTTTTTTVTTTTSFDLIDAADRTNPVSWTLFAVQFAMTLFAAVAAQP